jgi:hypothetical protein
MTRNGLERIARSSCLLAAVLSSARPASAPDAYLRMAPLKDYMMSDRNAEVELARSAAPPSISRGARVLVLTSTGYQTEVEGQNGFVCLVERSWMSPLDSPEYWNAKIRGPICYNPPAVRSILPLTFNRTKLVLAGRSKAEIKASLVAAVDKHELPMPETGAISYMLSKSGYLADAGGHWTPHLMFHVPKTDSAAWGANLAGSPVVANDEFRDFPEPETIFMVPVARWSDGTPAPVHAH